MAVSVTDVANMGLVPKPTQTGGERRFRQIAAAIRTRIRNYTRRMDSVEVLGTHLPPEVAARRKCIEGVTDGGRNSAGRRRVRRRNDDGWSMPCGHAAATRN